jgi:hypothetical protein
MALGNPTHRAVGYAAAASASAASTTVPSGDVIYAFIAARKNTSAFGASDFTISDTAGHTWTKFFDRQAYDAGSNPRVAIQWFWAISNGSATTITGGHSEGAATFISIESGTIGASMVPSCTNFGANGNAAGDPSVTLGATPDSLTFSSNIAAAANGVTPPTGFTELVEQTNNGTHEVCYDNTSTWNATVSYTTGNVNMLAVVGEVDEVSSGGGAVTGTLAATETGGDTASFAGWVEASGTMAAAETGADTFAGSGGVLVAGTLAAVETGSDTASFAGWVEAVGTLAATETGSDTFAGTGTVSSAGAVTGTLAATEIGADTAVMSGGVAVSGTLAATETGADTAAFTGFAGSVTGTLDAVEVGADVADFTGRAGGASRGGDDAPGMRWRRAALTSGLARQFFYDKQVAEVADRLRVLPEKPKKKARALEQVAEVLDAVAASAPPEVVEAVRPAAKAVERVLSARQVASFDPAEVLMILEALAAQEAEARKRWRRRRDDAAILSILLAA